MKTIAVVNHKGGAAKTTTCASLAHCLAKKGIRVLCIDMDVQASLTFLLEDRTVAYPGTPSLAGLMTGAEAGSIENCIRQSPWGVEYIPASDSLHNVDKAEGADAARGLRRQLAGLIDSVDYCIIDTPPALGMLTINALVAADYVLMTSNADILPLQGLAKLFNTVSTVRKMVHPDLRVLGILPINHAARMRVSKEMIQMMQAYADKAGVRLFEPIRSSTAVRESQCLRQGLQDYAPRCNAAIDYRAFSEAVLGLTGWYSRDNQ